MVEFLKRPARVTAALAMVGIWPALAAGAAVPARHQAVVIAAPAAQPAASPVTTYHNDYYRSGQYVAPKLTFQRAAHMHIDGGFAGIVTGNLYAQPLYWKAPGSSGTGDVIVATESNHVTALDATTGKVVWDRTLAPPVQGGILPCGNISPEGITGTPVIDPATGSLYVVASADQGGNVESLAYGIDLKNGHVLPGWPVNVGASLTKIGFTPSWQGERGALALYGNQLYIPYGGRFGDCDNYKGTVVSIALQHPKVLAAWQTAAFRGGVWSVGGVTEADGSLYVATGNTSGASTWGGGEAIVRLTAALKGGRNPADYFAPANWQDLDNEDLDLGGTNPMPLDVAGVKLIVGLGKDGNAYVANRTHLGGIGGQVASGQVSSRQIIGGPVSWIQGSNAFVAFQGGGSASNCGSTGLTALRITGGAKPAIATAWCVPLSGAGGPIVTTTDGADNRIVWVTGAEGDNQLHGFSAANGKVVFAGGGSAGTMQNLRHFGTILSANGRLYVGSDNRIYSFTP